jgi:hypothetical protein
MEEESLEQITEDAPKGHWQQALCSTREPWAFCGQRLVRFEWREPLRPRVFLLSGQRRRAAYAELFTFCLMQEEQLDSTRSRFDPLAFIGLKSDTGSDDNPHLRFGLDFDGNTHVFQFYCQHGNDTGYSLWTTAKDLDPRLGLLLKTAGFVHETFEETEYHIKRQEPGDPLNGATFLDSIAADLKQQFILNPS